MEVVHNDKNAECNFLEYINDFLDYFYNKDRTIEERIRSIEDESIKYEGIPDWQYSYFSAIVHKLSLDCGLQTPIWSLNSRYILKYHYFPEEAYDNDDLRIHRLFRSPLEFKIRNMFIRKDDLKDK